MNTKQLRPGASRELRGARKTWGLDNFNVKTPVQLVNQILFRVLPVAGLGLAGGWADRLTLWLPMADMAAQVLRDAIGGRI